MDEERKEILEQLRTKRNELQEQSQKNIVIQNIKLLGKIELKEIETDKASKIANLYLVEEYNAETDEIMLKYYADDEFIGIDNNGEFIQTGFAREKYDSTDSIKDILENLKEEEEAQKDGAEREKTKQVYSLNELEEEEKDLEEKEETLNEETKISNLKINGVKGEVDLDQQINGETLRKIIGLSEEYKSIVPVRATAVGVKSTSEYCYVAKKTDNTCTVLGEDILKEDRQEGVNPYSKDIQVNSDGSISKESSISGFKIVNRPNLFLSVGYDENSSTRETTITDVSGRYGRENEVGFELEKNGDGWQNSNTRNVLRIEEGIDKSSDMQKKQIEHEEICCENNRVENIDNNKDNDLHEHFEITEDTIVPGKDITVEKWAEELGENPKVIVDRLKKEINKNSEREPNDIVNEIEDDYEMINREHTH